MARGRFLVRVIWATAVMSLGVWMLALTLSVPLIWVPGFACLLGGGAFLARTVVEARRGAGEIERARLRDGLEEGISK